MKKILCNPGYWDLILHKEKSIASLFRVVFLKTTKVVLSYNRGYIQVFYIQNNIFNKLYEEYGIHPRELSFNRTR